MATSFRLSLASVVVEPAEPTLAAWPTTDAAPIVRYPLPTRMNGLGEPAGIVGRPWCEFGRKKMSSAGAAFYTDMFGSASVEYVLVKAKLYDPRQKAWIVFWGKMWRPSFAEAVPGMAYGLSDFKVMLTDLIQIANWTVVVT